MFGFVFIHQMVNNGQRASVKAVQWSETREFEASQDSHNSITHVINFEKRVEVQVSDQISERIPMDIF